MDIHVSCFYAKAVAEVNAGKVDENLEAKAYIESDCHLDKTKSRYLILRAEQLKLEDETKASFRRKEEQTVRMAEWSQNRYKVSRRRSSSPDDVAPVSFRAGTSSFSFRRKTYLGGLVAMFDWVVR